MKFFIESWYLFVAALVSGGLLLWSYVRSGGVSAGLSCAQAVMLMNRERALVIDVREAGEFASGHVVGSKNCPLLELESATHLPKNKKIPLVVVCETGRQATRAVATLVKLGYTQAQPLKGGLVAWREGQFPLEK